MRRKPTVDPQTRILDAAENAVAECGFAGASLRRIAQEARVNLATVYYYFRSKRGLMEAVLKRRFGPLREEHLALLREFEAANPGRPLPVEKILEAMLVPPLRLAAQDSARRQAVRRLFGRIVGEPNAETQEMLRHLRMESRTAFLKALQRSLPEAPRADLLWSVEFVSGALAFTLCNPRELEVETRGACNPANTEKVLAEMIRFFSAGFHALGRRPRKG
ncbi:MAG TPA: TetR/AcrR family transcriptional regulator [Verrucomicrobiota bacterium]|nr:TetR/AcrR family transcriptional regulator [Verrucomicrobiota bacterium]HQH02622.1 TetR/AcrR family transcriptional regulator [Verrucomicrobiota bacterium]HQJ48238.1 TetR/AcrR family transcriptional regulator [Verrucomicrobiota bacterium]